MFVAGGGGEGEKLKLTPVSVSVSACYRSVSLLLLSSSPGGDAAKQEQAVHAKAPRMHPQF